jgi:uncharacterized repeat protein (TIGR03847 family)
MTASFELRSPDRFTAGAVGPPGERVFYLQGREDDRVVTLKSEKEQVRALADHLAGLLAELPEVRAAAEDEAPLLEPVEPAWAVGSLGVGYDDERQRFVIVAESVLEEEGAEAGSARFSITTAQAARFVETARALIRAGRPLCPLCSQPKNPEGHVCPRSNGHLAGA